MRDPAPLRAEMVERQLRAHGIEDERVLAAMGEVPREAFVPPRMRRRAYEDRALPIGEGQTISQPWIVAAICQALRLRGEERVLEVGTGSGYSACVLGLLAAEVVGVELQPALASRALAALAALGFDGVEVLVGEGSVGLPGRAPFDAIAVHAAAPEAPLTLLAQLAPGGRLVVPIAAGAAEELTLFTRLGDAYESESLGPCRFVPLLGAEGFGPAGNDRRP